MNLSDPDMVVGSKHNSKLRFLSYLEVFLKWRRLLIGTVLAAAAVSVTISLLMPNWYEASSTVMPPQQTDVLSLLGIETGSTSGGLLSSLASTGALGLLNRQMGAYNYLAILNSRTVLEDVVNKFNLMEEYKTPHHYMSEAVKELKHNADFSVTDEGTLLIEVSDKSPEQAAAMGNYFVYLLNKISNDLATRQSRDVKEFVGQQLAESKAALRSAEDSLRDYQERTGMIISPGEGEVSLGAIATMFAQKEKDEIQLAVLNKTFNPDFAVVKQLEMEIKELDAKLSNVPQRGVESFRLYRDMLIQQKMVEFLYPVYEKAKIDEQRNIPAAMILDKAVAPDRKSGPKRSLIVLGSVIGAFFFMFGIVLIRERLNGLLEEDPEERMRFDNAMRTLRGMLWFHSRKD